MTKRPKTLFTDGEGPLVFKDLARDIGQRFENGKLIFDTISLFNAYLAETGGPNSPGDTLSLWVPHLIAHGITDRDLYDEAKSTILANGAEDYIRILRENGWEIRVISTAYRHLWETVSPALGISPQHVSSTDISLDEATVQWNSDLQEAIEKTEAEILSHTREIDEATVAFKEGASLKDVFTSTPVMRDVGATLNRLYSHQLPRFGLSPLIDIPALNGDRKTESIVNISSDLGIAPEDLIYVGDSITDDPVNVHVKEGGGLAIAENGDRFALRSANLAIALENVASKIPILEAWYSNGWAGIKNIVESTSSVTRERELRTPLQLEVSFLEPGCDFEEVEQRHRLLKQQLRGNNLAVC